MLYYGATNCILGTNAICIGIYITPTLPLPLLSLPLCIVPNGIARSIGRIPCQLSATWRRLSKINEWNSGKTPACLNNMETERDWVILEWREKVVKCVPNTCNSRSQRRLPYIVTHVCWMGIYLLSIYSMPVVLQFRLRINHGIVHIFFSPHGATRKIQGFETHICVTKKWDLFFHDAYMRHYANSRLICTLHHAITLHTYQFLHINW